MERVRWRLASGKARKCAMKEEKRKMGRAQLLSLERIGGERSVEADLLYRAHRL